MVSVWVVSSVGGGFLLVVIALLAIAALVREERARRMRIGGGVRVTPTAAPLHELPIADSKGRWGLRIMLTGSDQSLARDQATRDLMRFALRSAIEE